MKIVDQTRTAEVSAAFLQQPLNDNHTNSTTSSGKPPLLISKRFLVVVLMFLGYVNEMIIRNNMNIAVVEMTSEKSYQDGNQTLTKPAEFDWDTKTVGIIISTIPYGGFFAIIGGLMASKLGGSVSCSLSMMVSGILTILHPICLYHSLNALLGCRILVGIQMCFYTVSAADVFSRWIPKSERSTLMAFAFNGVCVGRAIVNSFCGYIAHVWGWTMVFYVTGTISSILSVILFISVKNNPTQDKHISRKELHYILAEIDPTSKRKTANPYKSILTSSPVWALNFATFASSWLVTIILAGLPLFIKDVTQKNTKDVGLISSIPNLVGIFMFPAAGALLDYWKNNGKITTTRMHKIIISSVFLCQMALFIATTSVSKFSILVFFFTAIGTLWPFNSLILQIILVSIAPNDTSIVAGFMTFWFCVSTILSQTAMGFMTVHHSHDEWNDTFILTAGVLLVSTVVFILFASSEPQPWSTVSNLEEDQSTKYKVEELIEKRLPKIYTRNNHQTPDQIR